MISRRPVSQPLLAGRPIFFFDPFSGVGYYRPRTREAATAYRR
jgi:hypothetical protein